MKQVSRLRIVKGISFLTALTFIGMPLLSYGKSNYKLVKNIDLKYENKDNKHQEPKKEDLWFNEEKDIIPKIKKKSKGIYPKFG